MLQVTGTAVEVQQKTGGAPGQEFHYTEVAVLTGKASIERVRLGRDFKGAPPVEGQQVTLGVVVKAYAGRNGAGYQLTAVERIDSTAARPSLAAAHKAS